MEDRTILNEATQTINPITGRSYEDLGRLFPDEEERFNSKGHFILGPDPYSILEIQKHIGRMDVRTGKTNIQDYYDFINKIYDFIEETFTLKGDWADRFHPLQTGTSYIVLG